jgi:hypothetical protein
MNTGDFDNLLNQTLDRVLLARYETYAPSYRQFLRTRPVRDFRSVGSVRRNGGKGLSAVPEGGTYPRAALDESAYTFSVSKYGMTYSLSWESIINDDLDAFATLPDDMADDAIQEEMYFASSLYVDNSTLYSTTHDVDGTDYSNKGTATLTLANLEAAYNAMVKYPGDAHADSRRKHERTGRTESVKRPDAGSR